MGLTSCRWITIAGTLAHRRRGAQPTSRRLPFAVERAAAPYAHLRDHRPPDMRGAAGLASTTVSGPSAWRQIGRLIIG